MNPYTLKLDFERTQVKEFYKGLSAPPFDDLFNLNVRDFAEYRAACNSIRRVRAVLESLPEQPTVEQQKVAVRRIDRIWHATVNS